MTQLNRAVTVLSVTLIIAWGAVYYAFGLTAPLIASELGHTKPFIYGGFSLTLIVAGVASPFIGRAIDKSGGRLVMSLGSLAAAAGLALLGAAQGAGSFLFACAVCGVGMAMTFYDAAFASLAWIAHGRARRAIALVTLAGGLASTVFWPLTQAFLAHISWREVCFIYAAFHVVICAPLLFFGLPKAQEATPAESDPSVVEARPALSGRDRWNAFALFAAILVTHGFVNSGMGIHLLPALAVLGAEPALTILVGSLIGPAQVTGRLAEVFAGRRIPALALGVGALGAMPLAFFVLLIAPVGPASLGAYAILYGMGNGLTTIARGLIPLSLFGREGYGAMLGLLAAPALAAQAAAPTALALMSESFGVIAMLKLCALMITLAFIGMATLAWRYGVSAPRV